MLQDACDNVLFARVQRRNENYSKHHLGAFGSELTAAASFFEIPWTRVSAALTEADQAWLFGEASASLRGLGRLLEAGEPLRAALEMGVAQKDWQNAAIRSHNLGELELALGEVDMALRDIEQSTTYSARIDNLFLKIVSSSDRANALHYRGQRTEAAEIFRQAEEMEAIYHPRFPLLSSVRGFRYCELLLASPERAAWRAMTEVSPLRDDPAVRCCRNVHERATKTLTWVTWLAGVGLNHLTLGRAALYETILTQAPFRAESATGPATAPSRSELDAAVDTLRRAGIPDYLPAGLLARAWLRYVIGARMGPASTISDLNEAWEIAERGPMPLVQADIHLHRARLFGLAIDRDTTSYPWESVDVDLSEARRLIEKHGYWRRKEELEDAEAALKQLRAGT